MNSMFFLPTWPPEAGLVMKIALFLLIAISLGEIGYRVARLPRVLGWALGGFSCGPAALGLLSRDNLWDTRHWISIALGFLLFELGQRVDLAWLKKSPWMFATSLAMALLTFGAVFAALWLLNTPPLLASMAAALAMATGPAVTLTLTKEMRAQGQVTERMLLFTALNNIYAYLAASVLMAWLHSAYRGGWEVIVAHPLFLIFGSLVLAIAFAAFAQVLLRLLGRWPETQLIGLAALVLLAVACADRLNLSVALVALGMGAITRTLDRHRHFAFLDFGYLGTMLVILLIGLTAAGIDPRLASSGVIAGLALIAARLAGSSLVLIGMARPSGIELRKAALLALALTPMSAIALVLVNQTALLFPEFGPSLFAIMLSAIIVLEIAGPLLAAFALKASRETGEQRSNPIRRGLA